MLPVQRNQDEVVKARPPSDATNRRDQLGRGLSALPTSASGATRAFGQQRRE